MKKLIMISKNCRLCLENNITVPLKLKPMPLGEIYSKKKINIKKIKKFPVSLGFCNKCKNVQLMELINPSYLWQDFTYFSGQTKAIKNHFKILSNNFIKSFKIKKNNLVLDIGSNDGTFLEFFKKKNIKVVGVDPANNVAKVAIRKKIPTYIEFFNKKTVSKIIKKFGKSKIVLCFNTFAHSEDLGNMVKNISKILDKKGIFIFECQYLKDIYDKKILGTIFFEHMYYHSVTSLQNLFNLYDLELFKVKKINIQKGSILGFVCKKNAFKINNSVKKFLNLEKSKKVTSIENLKKLKIFINNEGQRARKILKQFKKTEIAVYGAARSGPTLAYNFKINKYPSVIYDDHPMKVGKYTPMESLQVKPTSELLKTKPKICIILAYLHSKNILKKNIPYLKRSGSFLLLYPKVIKVNYRNYKRYI